MLSDNLYLAFNFLLQSESDILHVKPISLAEVFRQGFSPIALINRDAFLTVTDPYINKKKGYPQWLLRFFLTDRPCGGKFATVYRFLVPLGDQ